MHSTNVYWLVLDPTENHFFKKGALEERGFSVTFFKTLSSMLERVATQRAGFYIVGDEGVDASVLKAVTTLSNHPDLAGAKLVLSISQDSPAVLRAAACEGFRDILPLKMADKEWAQRFLFSTATKPIDLPSPPKATEHDLAGRLHLPARLVTMQSNGVFIESRLAPAPGDRLELAGPFCQALGLPSIDLVVEERKAPHLRYRFSEGFYASWTAESLFSSPAGRDVRQAIQSFGGTCRPRIFLAIQSPALRAALMRHLDQKYYDIHSALQKRSIVEDPKFFAPHLVFIEERMCIQENLSRFAAMTPLLPADSTIVVLGDEVHKSALEGVSGGLRIVFLRQVPINLREVVEKNYLPASARQSPFTGAYPIPSDHEFSMGELLVPCRMKASHPTMVRLAVPKQVGSFALAALSVPWLQELLGKNPYVKIMQIHPGESSAAESLSLADCYFCDITMEQRKMLAHNPIPATSAASSSIARPIEESPEVSADAAVEESSEVAVEEAPEVAVEESSGALPKVSAKSFSGDFYAPATVNPQPLCVPHGEVSLQQKLGFTLRHWIMLTIVLTIGMTILWLSILKE